MQYYTALLNSKELFYNDNSGTDTAQIKAINSTYKDQIMVIKPLQISHTTTHCPRRRLRDLSTVNLHRANSLFKNSTTETYRNFLKVTTCYSIFRCHYRRHGAAKVLTSFYSKAEMNGITLCYSCGGAFCVKASVGVTPSPTDKYQDLLTWGCSDLANLSNFSPSHFAENVYWGRWYMLPHSFSGFGMYAGALFDNSDPIGQGVTTVAVPLKTMVHCAVIACEGNSDPLPCRLESSAC